MRFLFSSRFSNGIPWQARPTGIHALPSELLCSIFLELPTRPQSFLDSPNRSAPPVHTLSHVCSLWRSVAQDLCPSLWTDIRIFHCRAGQLAVVEAYLRRSGDLPLDIVLDIPGDASKTDEGQFWQVVLRVWSTARRWRSLHLRTTSTNHAALRENVGGGSLDTPLLESLALSLAGVERSGVISGAATRGGAPRMHFEGLPMLKSLVLHGVTLGTDLSLFAHRLENITLAFVPGGGWTLLAALVEEFRLKARDFPLLPSLRHLTLRESSPCIINSEDSRSYLFHLKSLTLSFDRVDLPAMCRTINASLLEELSLHGLTNTSWSSFSSLPVTFPLLHTLTLSACSTSGACFFPGDDGIEFPALTHLRLSDFASFSDLLTDLGVSALESSPPTPPPWPTLTALTITGNPDYRALRVFVDARSAMGVPLQSLTVDSPRFIDASALNWLKKNVEEFTRLVSNSG